MRAQQGILGVLNVQLLQPDIAVVGQRQNHCILQREAQLAIDHVLLHIFRPRQRVRDGLRIRQPAECFPLANGLRGKDARRQAQNPAQQRAQNETKLHFFFLQNC